MPCRGETQAELRAHGSSQETPGRSGRPPPLSGEQEPGREGKKVPPRSRRAGIWPVTPPRLRSPALWARAGLRASSRACRDEGAGAW